MKPRILSSGVQGTDCEECNHYINEAVWLLEANVDSKYRIAETYNVAVRSGISRCSIHGIYLQG
jgi:hypothetical protein